jgi:hypothetical protein
MTQKSVQRQALVNTAKNGRFPLNAENSATSSTPRRRPDFYGVTYSISYFTCVGKLDDLTNPVTRCNDIENSGHCDKTYKCNRNSCMEAAGKSWVQQDKPTHLRNISYCLVQHTQPATFLC